MISFAAAMRRSRQALITAAPASLIAVLALTNSSVMAQQMDVPPQSAPHSNGVGAAVTDSAITTKVKTKLLGDKRLDQSHVNVTTNNGMVALSGTAPTAEAKQAAESDAQSVDGVKSIDNQIEAPSGRKRK